MGVIYYKNIETKYIQEIISDFTFVKYQGQDVLPEEAVLFLLGEGPGLVQMVQKINKENPLLSLLILPSVPRVNNNLKMAIQFSPFINQNVTIVDTVEKSAFKALIEREAALTIARKSFNQKQEKAISQLSPALKSDHVLRSQFLDNFLLQAPVGAVLLSKNNLILDLNAYAKDLLGDNVKRVAKPFIAIFQHEKDKVEAFLNHKTTDGEGVSVETDGEIKHLKLYMSQIDTANASYKMIILLDVTREVLAEEKAQEYLQEVERHNKELKQFANVVSHDLKNPLSTIKLSCKMAADGSVEEKDKYISIINRSSENLLQMIQGLEKIIDVRQDKQNASRYHFQQIFKNVLNEYQYQVTKEDIKITCDFDQAPAINYIESYLISIFHNMISNAIKYSKTNEPLRLHVKTQKSGSYILLKFSDNGIGIDLKEHGKNLFQPFKRFSQQAQGKGIGLSIIKSMIEKNNGKIEVESAPGEGTTFLCYLCPYKGR